MSKVLIIDDDLDIIETMVSILENQGFELVTLNCAKKAVELLKTDQFHTIISDLSMPGMSGLEFLTELRKMGISTPLIFVTGSDLSDSLLKVLQAGAVDYMAKPFNIDAMLEKVNQFVKIGRELKKEAA